jgi:hypothetical protein
MAVNGTRGFAVNLIPYDHNHADPFIKPLKYILNTNNFALLCQSGVQRSTLYSKAIYVSDGRKI